MLHIYGATDRGMVREANEDRFAGEVFDRWCGYAVLCDGMGGEIGGGIAAGIAAEEVRRMVESSRGMGSTLCAAVISDGTALVANVGDSRCYLLREGVLTQLTQDHTAVAELVRQGLLTPEDAAHHPDRHAITRAIGVEPEVLPDHTVIDLARGDALLLCSDGLYNTLPPEELAAMLPEILNGGDIHTLIDKANAAGGPDNITAVLIHNR